MPAFKPPSLLFMSSECQEVPSAAQPSSRGAGSCAARVRQPVAFFFIFSIYTRASVQPQRGMSAVWPPGGQLQPGPVQCSKHGATQHGYSPD